MKRVRELVHREVKTIRGDATVAEALPLAEESASRKLVIERRGELAGMVCVCDLQHAEPGTRVEALMSMPVETIEANAFADDAFTRMRVLGIGSLLVEQEGEPAGLLTLEDALGPEGVRCVRCESPSHVRLDPASGSWLCLDCTNAARAAEREEIELGAGD